MLYITKTIPQVDGPRFTSGKHNMQLGESLNIIRKIKYL
jgi:hypothetical protein